jgi:hypothetical protein
MYKSAEASHEEIIQAVQREAGRLAKRFWRERRRLPTLSIDDPTKLK